MPFPQNVDQLREEGYKFSDHGVCRGCKEDIEWWHSPPPQSKPIPLNPMNGENGFKAVPHWATCPNAADFRKKR